MFGLFFSLYLALFTGEWVYMDYYRVTGFMRSVLDGLGEFITNIFGDGSYNRLGATLFDSEETLLFLISFVLATITVIGIAIFVVKGIKHIFTIFFEGLR